MGYPTQKAKDKPVWIIFEGSRVGIGAKSSIPSRKEEGGRVIIEEATPEQYEKLADTYPEYISKGSNKPKELKKPKKETKKSVDLGKIE